MVSISQERARLAALGIQLRRREQWGAKRSYTDPRSVTEPATQVFVHISVTEPGNYSSFDAHARAIEAIGISRFPNTGISYNRLFMAGTRTVYEGQPISRRGAHTVNDFKRSTCSTSGCPGRGGSLTAPSWNNNLTARSYVYCANVHHGVPDHVVEDMARVIAADKLAGFVTKGAQIHGHRCVSSKSCPGDKMWARMGELEELVDRYLSTGLNGDDDMTPEQAKQLAMVHKVLTNGGTSLVEYPTQDKVGSIRYGVQRAWYWCYAAAGLPIPPNSWMAKRWPTWPAEGYSPRVSQRAAHGYARMASEEAKANGKQIAQLAARQAATENLLQQLLDAPGQPVDMDQVSAAALAGAQQAMAELSITVTVNPAEEPTGTDEDES